MSQHSLKAISTVIALVLLGGCTTQEAAEKPAENTYLNQVQLDELVAIEVEPQSKSKSVAKKDYAPFSHKAEKSTYAQTGIPEAEGKVHTSSYNHAPELAPAVSAVQRVDHTSLSLNQAQVEEAGFVMGNWPAKPSQRVVRAFTTDRNDSFKETISRWLLMEGYKTTRFILSEDIDNTLDKDTDVTGTYYDSLPTALNELSSVASQKDIDYKTRLPKDFKLYVSLNNKSRSATVYSVNNALEIHHDGNPVDTKLLEPEQSYQVFKGESYEAALYRWIGDVGYLKFGKLVNEDVTKVLSQKIPVNDTINEDFSQATTLLMLQAVEQAKDDHKNEKDGFISESGKSSLELHLFLNDIKHEAILTSSNQPVTMFTVSKGSLKDNFNRLADFYSWNKNVEDLDTHFMANDFEIDFSYPIVSEKGNIERALTELLDGFPNLRGAIVPSTRTAYVVKEN